MNKRTLRKEADIIDYMENKHSKRIDRKYVGHRTNGLAEIKRIYLYLMGNMKGFTAFGDTLKERHPEAKSYRGNNVEWHFIYEDIWKYLLENEKMSQIIKAMKIESYEELCNRVDSKFF